MDRETCKSRDILSRPWLTFLFFWLPWIAMAASAGFHLSSGWRAAVWIAGLLTMGAACLVNAARCGRLHCYLTGPFLLVMALVTLLYGLGVVPLGRNGWNVIAGTAVVGALALCFLPEMFLGTYRTRA
jgi:hypothetical protein